MGIEDRRWYRWAVVFMLWIICFFNYADRQAIFSVFRLLKRELHVQMLNLASSALHLCGCTPSRPLLAVTSATGSGERQSYLAGSISGARSSPDRRIPKAVAPH